MKRSDAARCTAWPPATEPVNATKSTRGSRIDALGVRVTQVQSLEHAVRQARFAQALREALRAQRRLRGMLQDHRVAGHQCRHDAVHRDEIRIVPGGDREHDAERLAADEAREVLLRPRIDVGERVGRDRDHVARALERAAHFVRRVADRPAHLPRQLERDLVALALRTRRRSGCRMRARSATETLRQARCAVRARSSARSISAASASGRST